MGMRSPNSNSGSPLPRGASGAAPATTSVAADAAQSLNGLGGYLQGVRSELKKAEWPTRPELIRLTQVVLLLIGIVAVYCGAMDAVLSFITDKIFVR